MKKLLLSILAIASTLGVFAQEKYEQGKPNDPNYTYLNDYAALKEYIDHEKYPNFKLGVGTTVSEYNKKGLVYKLTNANFTETVAGNAMKMSSCVSNNGTMNFTTVKTYVNNATAAGLNVYGHTLAWHAQQPKGWLLSLMADKPGQPIVDPDTTMLVLLANKDFRTQQSVGWHANYNEYHYSISFSSTDGMKVTNTQKQDNWLVQYIGMENIPTEKDVNYTVTMTVKGSGTGYVAAKLGDWGSGSSKNFNFTNEWKEVKQTYKATVAGSFLLLQSGQFVGDLYIKNIKVEKEEPGKKATETRRSIMVNADAKVSDVWDNQFWVVASKNFANGAKYEFTADVRADKPAKASTQIHAEPGTYKGNGIGDVQFTTAWQTVKFSGYMNSGGKSIAFNLSEFAEANKYYFDNLSLKINGVEQLVNGDCEGSETTSFFVKEARGEMQPATISENTVTYVIIQQSEPMTKEEKHDTLVWAMEKWISGMMQACDGKVKAWDVVNEAISGGGNDGQGNYALQHSDGYNPDGTWDVGGDAFYWQDYLGDLDYVRQAVRLARKYGPEDIKLFINDYNLESDWDNNKKLKSLINWIKKWEDDGVTYIDGIGTQMHISCYKNTNTQNSKKSHITQMFELMAQSGKLVRVSELDMGYVDINGKDVATNNMTEEQHREMADFYKWIIQEYLRIIPADQQWGICQWCATDSPSNSGWRANTPVGIWDINYYRKHVYAGFAEGLGGVPTAITDVHVDAPALQNVYSLDGVCLKRGTTSLDGLKPGMYIVGGKKVVLN